MPDRLSRLAAMVGPHQAPARCCSAQTGTNDNLRLSPAVESFGPPEPCWAGPGAILALGVQDGRHGLGAVRAAAGEATGDAATDMATLLRLLTHYGMWLGFEGEPKPLRTGKLRRMLVEVGARGKVEYRLDLRRIARGAQRLTADGTILLDGRPAVTLDGFSIVFRPPGAASRRPRPQP